MPRSILHFYWRMHALPTQAGQGKRSNPLISPFDHRVKRRPSGAPAVAVFASLRLRCGARSEAASRNSLRSLCSLRSNRRDESVYEARFRAPASNLRSSPPHRSPPPGAACRDAWHRLFFGFGRRRNTVALQRRAQAGCGAPSEALRSAGLLAARVPARFVNILAASCLNATSEASEVSCAAGQKPEHRRAAVAKRRPLQPSAAASLGTLLPSTDCKQA